MSNDKTTLADVQPGGRVRLGDGLRSELLDQAERLERMAAQDRETGESIEQALEAGEEYTPDDAPDVAAGLQHDANRSEEIAALLRKAAAALSAQPSPGGQDALAALQQDYDKLLDSFNRQVEVAEKIAGRVLLQDDRIEELEEALAARQPVGEPAYNSAGISLTACQLHEALLMAGDPELDVPFEDRSLVRIFWTDTGHSGPGLYCECVGAEEEGCILLDGTAPAIGQSSQAVDLAMPIAMIDQALGHLSTALDDLDSSPDARPGAMVTEAMGCLRQALTGVQP